MSEWPKTVIVGLSRAGDEYEERLRPFSFMDDANWSFVRTAYRLYEDGRREDCYGEALITDVNNRLKEAMSKAASAAETQNAMFDRIKREAHERRERENDMRIKVATPAEVARFHAEHALVDAMSAPAPHEVPLLAGPRPGMER